VKGENTMADSRKIAILGGGNIGVSIAQGLYNSKEYNTENIIVTRRKTELLHHLAEKGFVIQSDNVDAVKRSDIIIIAVRPQQTNDLLDEIKSELDESRHVIISIVSGASIKDISGKIGKNVPVIRAMPNIAIAIGESMTCIAVNNAPEDIVNISKNIFKTVGHTEIISEELMTPATALCACGVAFFLRAIRAASQGGIEIGFHPEEALPMAAQTAKGAAALLLSMANHPESEIDKVTTPRGCTISGLNEMEHNGFSSAMIKGIKTSWDKASCLYDKNEK
jgi:pyrroline-5-carboxylate reductase